MISVSMFTFVTYSAFLMQLYYVRGTYFETP
jgi:hypothetical protein